LSELKVTEGNLHASWRQLDGDIIKMGIEETEKIYIVQFEATWANHREFPKEAVPDVHYMK
jgi:hypothetical protein